MKPCYFVYSFYSLETITASLWALRGCFSINLVVLKTVLPLILETTVELSLNHSAIVYYMNVDFIIIDETSFEDRLQPVDVLGDYATREITPARLKKANF